MFLSKDNRITNPNEEKRYNQVLQRYVNYYDIYDYMIHLDNDLDLTLDLKEQVINFYKNSTYENAWDNLTEVIKDLRNSTIPQMIDFSNTLSRWKHEIVNSFITVKKSAINTKINNGIIENRNKSIKIIKHNSNGYQNWERFRNRVLYSLNSDTTFYLNPLTKKKAG